MKTHEIIVLFDSKNVGDKNQSVAVAQSLQKLLGESKPKISEIEEGKLTEKEISSFTSNHIVIAAGNHGLSVIQKIKNSPASSKPKTILTGHQFFAEQFKLLKPGEYPDLIGMPQAALTSEQIKFLGKNSQFVSLLGVPHTVTEESVTKDIKEFKKTLPVLTGKHLIGIILSGDAPDHENKTTRFFTEKDARYSANKIIAFLKESGLIKENSYLIITNGFRTGQYDYSTGKILEPNPHTIGETDQVSAAFLDELKQLGIPKEHIGFYNFDTRSLPSMYKPMLKMLSDNQGVLFVPEESTSMATESEYLARKGGKVIVYEVSSQNAVHVKHIYSLYQLGMFGLLDSSGKYLPAPVQPKFADISDAEKMAQATFEFLKKEELNLSSSKDSIFSSSQEKTPDLTPASSNENTFHT